MDILSLGEPCKFPSTAGCPAPGLEIRPTRGRARAGPLAPVPPAALGRQPASAVKGEDLGSPAATAESRGEKGRDESTASGAGGGARSGAGARVRGAGLPRQAPAQQASSSSSRSGDAGDACPGGGPGRRLAARGISAPTGGSGLGTLLCAAPLGALPVPRVPGAPLAGPGRRTDRPARHQLLNLEDTWAEAARCPRASPRRPRPPSRHSGPTARPRPRPRPCPSPRRDPRPWPEFLTQAVTHSPSPRGSGIKENGIKSMQVHFFLWKDLSGSQGGMAHQAVRRGWDPGFLTR